jgi:hypothetical protein
MPEREPIEANSGSMPLFAPLLMTMLSGISCDENILIVPVWPEMVWAFRLKRLVMV